MANLVNLHDSGEISLLMLASQLTSYWTTLKIHYKIRFKRPFQALRLKKNSGKCQNNASFPQGSRGKNVVGQGSHGLKPLA
jgi:hypothetical protein